MTEKNLKRNIVTWILRPVIYKLIDSGVWAHAFLCNKGLISLQS